MTEELSLPEPAAGILCLAGDESTTRTPRG